MHTAWILLRQQETYSLCPALLYLLLLLGLGSMYVPVALPCQEAVTEGPVEIKAGQI